jgi:hypothetical protein
VVVAVSSLAPLALLACPIGMGLMMWFMGRGMRRDKTEDEAATPRAGTLEDLRAEHERLSAHIEALEERERDATPADTLGERR